MDNLIEYKEGAGFSGTGTDWESKVEKGRLRIDSDFNIVLIEKI